MIEIKICGVCRAVDARAAAEAGAGYVGVILAQGRTRSRTLAEAEAILDAGGVRRVGVFVDAGEREVIEASRTLRLDAVQLHGDESPDSVRRIRDAVEREVWKAIRVRDITDIARARAYDVDALVLDGWSPDAHGGAGVAFDWAGVADSGVMPTDVRLVAAGGLTPANVATAIRLLRPAVVDVSSGVEDAPGRKSMEKILEFVAAVRDASRPEAVQE